MYAYLERAELDYYLKEFSILYLCLDVSVTSDYFAGEMVPSSTH